MAKALPLMQCWESKTELPEEGSCYPGPSVLKAAEEYAKHLDAINGTGSRTICVFDRERGRITSVNVESEETLVVKYTTALVEWSDEE